MLHGGIAQLGERLNGIQEVRGSTPLISTSTESGLLSVDKSSDFCLYRIRRPYFPEDLPLPIARFRILLGNLYAKKFSDFSGNPLLFCRMCAIILALHRGIAQLVEYRSPKPWVAGSNPPAPAMLCGQNRSARGKQPFGKPNSGKTGDFERFLPFFRPCIFSEFHRSLLPFSMLCPDSDSRKGLFCVFPKAIGSVAGFGLAKAEPDSSKKPPLHKLFTNTFGPSSNCPDLNSRNKATSNPIYFCLATDKNKNDSSLFLSVHILTFLTILFFTTRKFWICSSSAGLAVTLTVNPQTCCL